MNSEILLEKLESEGNEQEAEKIARYHKTKRLYLGVRVPKITAIAKSYFQSEADESLIVCCRALWQTDIHEARILVGKLFEVQKQKQFDGDQVWKFISQIKDDLDGWAISDHLSKGAWRCLQAEPKRIDELETEWLVHKSFWVRRAALVYTLYISKKGGKPERVLKWAAYLVDDHEWFIQKAIGWWLRELSKHNPARVEEFIQDYAHQMKPFAVKEATKYVT